MRSRVISAQEVRDVEISSIPEGEYVGILRGNEAEFAVDGVTYQLRTLTGIRSPSAPCTVIVKNGEAHVDV